MKTSNRPAYTARFIVSLTSVSGIAFMASGLLHGCTGGKTTAEILPQERHRPVRSLPVQVTWHSANAREVAIARHMVQQQLRAFRSGDYAAALALLAPEMRGANEKPEQLRSLIQDNYPEFAQVTRIRWRNAYSSANGMISIRLHFLAANGNLIGTGYTLSRKADGRYLISGIFSEPLRINRRSARTSPSSENAALEQFFRAPDTPLS